jgi:hypothetical protein
MSRVDLYPSANSAPDEALLQTGTTKADKVGADVHLLGGVVGSASVPADYDQAIVTYPTAVTEVYVYRKLGVTIKTVTITYTNASKVNISGWTIA